MNKDRFNYYVDRFKNAKDRNDNNLNMHYFLVKNGDNVYSYAFNKREEKSDIRSISKTVMTLTAGIVNRLSLEGKYNQFDDQTYIYPIIKDRFNLNNKANLDYLNKIQVKHLLTHSIGFDKVLMMRDDIKDIDPFDYVNMIINHPIKYQPGEYYLYSNAGIYLLSVVLQEFLGEELIDFIDRELFTPLKIKDYQWEKYGNYLAGATRLWLYPEDLLKIGELMLYDGKFEGKNLIHKEWIDKMKKIYFRTESVDTPGANFRRYGYGYGIWLPKDDFYFGHGTDGQILAVLPWENSIIITQAYQNNVQALEEIVDEIIGELKNK